MPVPEIAAELQDLFIDYLSNDRETLRKCGLVSKPWNRRSRKLCFHDLKAVISVHRKCHTTASEDFVKLVESQHSTIADYIRKLTIQGPERFGDSETSSHWNTHHLEEYSTLAIFLPRLVLHLPNLYKITLRHVVWNQLPIDTQLAMLSFPAKELVWEDIIVDNLVAGYYALMGMIHQSGLKKLQLWRVGATDQSVDSYAFSDKHMEALSSLSFLEVTSGHFGNPVLIAMQRLPPRLHTVRLRVQEIWHLPLIAEFIRHLGREIKSLTLGGKGLIGSFFSENFAGQQTWSPLSLENNTNLQMLHIVDLTYADFVLSRMERRFFSPEPLLALLDTVASPGLKELAIHYSTFPNPRSALFSLGIFDKGLAERSPSVPKFRFLLYLPSLHDRGPYYENDVRVIDGKLVYPPPLAVQLAECFPRLYEQRRVIFEVDGQEKQIYPPVWPEVPEVVVDTEGMTCTGWPGPSEANAPLPESDDDL